MNEKQLCHPILIEESGLDSKLSDESVLRMVDLDGENVRLLTLHVDDAVLLAVVQLHPRSNGESLLVSESRRDGKRLLSLQNATTDHSLE